MNNYKSLMMTQNLLLASATKELGSLGGYQAKEIEGGSSIIERTAT